jgi:hypothetical protein
MKDNRKVTFRRIRGRLVPIRIRDKVEGGAKVAAGAGLGAAAGFGVALGNAAERAGKIRSAVASEAGLHKVASTYRLAAKSLRAQSLTFAALGIGAGIVLARSGLNQSLSKETKNKTSFSQYGSLAAAIGVGAAAALSVKRFSGLGKRESVKQVYKLIKGIK